MTQKLRMRSNTQLSPFFKFNRDVLLCITLPLTLRIGFSDPYNGLGGQGQLIQGLASDSGNIFIQALTLFVFVNSLFLVKLSLLPPRAIARAMAPLMGLLLISFISIAWSDYPDLTFRRGFHIIIETTTIILLALTYSHEPNRVLRLLFRIFAIVTVANALSLALPSISFSPLGFNGIHMHKLDAGRFFFFAIPIFVLGILYKSVSGSRVVAAILFLIALGLLPITHAKTSLVCVPLAILLTLSIRMVYIGNASTRLFLPLIYALLALIMVLVTYDLGVDTVFNLAFGDATLTGRTEIWNYILYLYSLHPILGVGYGALWQTGTSLISPNLHEDYLLLHVNQAHNGYLDILAQLGLFGFAMLLLFLTVIFVRLNSFIFHHELRRFFGLASYGMYLLLGSVIYNFTDSTYFRPGTTFWILLVFISTCVGTRAQKDQLSAPAPEASYPAVLRTLGTS